MLISQALKRVNRIARRLGVVDSRERMNILNKILNKGDTSMVYSNLGYIHTVREPEIAICKSGGISTFLYIKCVRDEPLEISSRQTKFLDGKLVDIYKEDCLGIKFESKEK